MAQTTASPAEMIPQLEAARKLVLGDAHFYPQIVPGILPIIGPSAPLEVRRWGAEFLAETFASPALGNAQKDELGSIVLPNLKGMLETPGEDAAVVKSVVQTVASVYSLIFRKCISHPEEAQTWQNMVAIKSNILRRMDTASAGVRVCCIKLLQKIVQVQTPGVISDPRRPEQNETSIALVPRNHPFLSLPQLEAEASGLLDRLLDVFQQNISDPILVDATMNCMGILVRSRPAVANKIISAILNFNPLKQANSPMTPRLRVIVRSMERTTRALLKNINKYNPNGPLASKIDAYLVRLTQSRSAVFVDAQSLKRPAPVEPIDGLDDAKRVRLTGSAPRKYPHMPPPPNSFAQLFTLTEDAGLKAFDVKALPVDMINTITSLTLKHVDQQALDEAIGVIRSRYTHIQKMQQPTPIPDVPMAGPTGIDDEDDYDPEYDPENEAISAPAAAAQTLQELMQPDITLGPFELAKPPPLTTEDVQVLSRQTKDRFMETIDTLPVPTSTSLRQKLGMNRLAASANDRDAWVTILTRLATRAPSHLEDVVAANVDREDDGENSIKMEDPNVLARTQASLANDIRDGLFGYIAQDFKSRLNVAISWLSEEWYSDKLSSNDAPKSLSPPTLPNYYPQLLRILDYMITFLDARDNKLLIRFLSEIPAINADVLDRVKMLSMDPERIGMCMMSLQYLILMRPPVRAMVLDVLEGMYRDAVGPGGRFKEAKGQVEKVLKKWRPSILEAPGEVVKGEHDAAAAVKADEAAVAPALVLAPSSAVKMESVATRTDPRKRPAISAIT